MAVTVVSGVQYSGIWNISSQANAKGAGTWPLPPQARLYAWGRNSKGQLGLGNVTNYSSPKQINATANWLDVSACYANVFAIKSDNTLWASGWNLFGQLGLNNNTDYSSPVQVGSLATWSAIGGGGDAVVAVQTNGTLWAWGNGANGILGRNNNTSYSSPKQVGALTNWSSVAKNPINNYYAFGIKTNGTLWSWGQNQYGELGLGNTTVYSSPKQVGALTNWLKVSSGGYQILSIKTDGTIWSWGRNSNGALGLGNIVNYFSPMQIGSGTNWLDICAGYQHSMAVKADGTLWAWGRNNWGQLGLGTSGAGTYKSSPTQVGSLTTWLSVAGGIYSTIALKTDGTIWSWGNGGNGVLGVGNTANYSSPIQIGALTTWTKPFQFYTTPVVLGAKNG